RFDDTRAARADYQVFDLTMRTPLLTAKEADQSSKQWDTGAEIGLRYDTSVKNVEYHRHVKPILDRSCTACHTAKHGTAPGNLVLDDESPVKDLPGVY